MIDEKLFYTAKSLASSLEEICLTSEGKVRAFNVANAGLFKRVEKNAFLAIEECFYAMTNGIHGLPVKSMTAEIYAGACEASTPWSLGDLSAILYPENHQGWESDDEAYVEESKGTYCLTHFGEIAFNRYLAEAGKLIGRATIQAA